MYKPDEYYEVEYRFRSPEQDCVWRKALDLSVPGTHIQEVLDRLQQWYGPDYELRAV